MYLNTNAKFKKLNFLHENNYQSKCSLQSNKAVDCISSICEISLKTRHCLKLGMHLHSTAVLSAGYTLPPAVVTTRSEAAFTSDVESTVL